MPWKLVIIKFITEEIKMNVPMDISKTATPELKKLDNKFKEHMASIETFSLALDKILSKTDMSNEVKLLFIDKFINALLDVANSN